MSGIGIAVVVVVLLAATAFGIWNRRTSGRIADRAPASPTGIEAASAGEPPVDIETEPLPEESAVLVAALDGRLGERATMVQFSTAFCQPCRPTRRILEEVAVMVPGVSHVEIDAEDNLDLVRALDIKRTPTVLFLDARGLIRKHASGQPRKPDVIAALGQIIPGGDVDYTI